MIREIIFLNGAYDLACALSHLLNRKNFLTKLHGDLFSEKDTISGEDLQQRMLAYWILTYGIVRFASIALLFDERAMSWESMAAVGYLVEAMAYALEGFVYRTVDRRKAAFVSGTSAALGAGALCLIFCYK